MKGGKGGGRGGGTHPPSKVGMAGGKGGGAGIPGMGGGPLGTGTIMGGAGDPVFFPCSNLAHFSSMSLRELIQECVKN